MNFMDYCFITILILCGFAGMYQGLVRSILSIASIFITFFISINYYPRLASIIIHQTHVDDILKKSITSNLNTTLQSIPGVDTLMKINDAFINLLMGNIHVPLVLRNFVLDNIHIDIQNFSTAQIIDTISSKWTDIFINIMAFIILFAILQFIFTLLQNFFGALVTLPILSEVNMLGGLVLGILQGFIVLYVICLGWSMLSGSPMYDEVFADLNASKYAKHFYDNNLLLNILVRYKII